VRNSMDHKFGIFSDSELKFFHGLLA